MKNEILIQSGSAQAVVRQPGAQLISWCSEPGNEQIFLSELSDRTSDQPLRGGVPIIFPQFGELGNIKRHGFARDLDWQVASVGQGRAEFELVDSAATRKYWDYSFLCRFAVICRSTQLQMELSVHNHDNKPFSFCAALHTYFHVDNFEHCYLTGLRGCDYWDNGTDFSVRQKELSSKLHFSDAIDRVYFNTPDCLELTEAERVKEILSPGFVDTVVWNPGTKAALVMSDLGESEFTKMLCVESAVVDDAVELAPGERWTGSQVIKLLPADAHGSSGR
jgi:glucose-6-phosphate 1-epimerase